MSNPNSRSRGRRRTAVLASLTTAVIALPTTYLHLWGDQASQARREFIKTPHMSALLFRCRAHGHAIDRPEPSAWTQKWTQLDGFGGGRRNSRSTEERRVHAVLGVTRRHYCGPGCSPEAAAQILLDAQRRSALRTGDAGPTPVPTACNHGGLPTLFRALELARCHRATVGSAKPLIRCRSFTQAIAQNRPKRSP